MKFMSFFSIVPRDEGFLSDYSNAIPLDVVRSSGINSKPNLDISVTDLSKGYKHFYNNGSLGITFKISILIHKDDKKGDMSITSLLDDCMRNMTPLLVYTDAIDIPNDNTDAYIITKNDSRQQTYDKYTQWDLEFMTYTPITVARYINNNAGVLKAIDKAKQHKNTIKKASTKNAKLRKCNYKTLVYSKKKKVVKCVKYMQKVLKKNKYYTGKIDGWFGKDTKNSVKKFQKAYNKKVVKVNTKKTSSDINMSEGTLITNTNNNLINTNGVNISGVKNTGATVNLTGLNKILRVDGKVDKATWKALCNS